ncbi:MAG: hypothetical protein LJE87_00570 [Deltaproteobacteria bacterium]|jgi:hypothetical protein|nr:hypothetical protein [Deltaproteobacteria bacterium]
MEHRAEGWRQFATIVGAESTVGVEKEGLSPKANGLFPWPQSPGQGNNKLLCDLCVSVVST